MFWGLILLALFIFVLFLVAFVLFLVATALLGYAAVRTTRVLLREPDLRTPRRITAAIAASIGLVACAWTWYLLITRFLNDGDCFWCHG